MDVITSVSNNRIKDTVKLQQKKYRNEKGLFLIEGYKAIFEAQCESIQIETVYTTEKHIKKFEFIKDKITIVTDAILEKISTTDSKSEAVAVAKQVNIKLTDIKNKKRIVLIENVKDAGNLGTLLRSAAAFNIEAVILAGETTDRYNPKVIRSTVGALFKVPVVKASIDETKNFFKTHDFIAAVVNHKSIVKPENIDFSKPFVLMLGSEANGLTQTAIDIANIKTTIPIASNTESLNLSVAGSILFYICSRKICDNILE